MIKFNIQRISLPLIYLLVIFYLLINTGLFSDDFALLSRLKGASFLDTLISKNGFVFIATPFEHLTHYIWYYFFRVDSWALISMIKVLYMFLSLYMISRFFRIYLDRQSAYLLSFLFIFFPSHETTVYWFMIQYLTLSFAFYLYAFYLAHNNRLVPAFFLALAASFISYGSPPLAMALFILFALKKEYKKGLTLLIPNIVYSAYYLLVAKFLSTGTSKVATTINLYSFAKHFILQILTFIDAMIGPSMWLKLYYSFAQLQVPSIIIGILLTVIFYKKFRGNGKPRDNKLVVCFILLTLLSFAIFALTGLYPQLTFNLGNRVTIFGSLLLAYLIISASLSHKLRTLVFAVLIFSILGISDHWKDWNIHQQKIISNIKNNEDLKNYRDERILYISGNQYSRYGPVSHIEFLSESWVGGPLINLLCGKNIPVNPINKRHIYIDGYLLDIKYDSKDKVNGYINVYDSEKNTLFRIPDKKINDYIDSLPAYKRHWVQISEIKFIKNNVLKLMPRLKYAF